MLRTPYVLSEWQAVPLSSVIVRPPSSLCLLRVKAVKVRSHLILWQRPLICISFFFNCEVHLLLGHSEEFYRRGPESGAGELAMALSSLLGANITLERCHFYSSASSTVWSGFFRDIEPVLVYTVYLHHVVDPYCMLHNYSWPLTSTVRTAQVHLYVGFFYFDKHSTILFTYFLFPLIFIKHFFSSLF